jgi:U3 small nucleolar RNA-associated protein 21
MEFSDNGAITTISFRKDGKKNNLIAGNDKGEVSIWDIEKKKLIIKNKIHSDIIKTSEFIQDKPILLTSSPDNTIKLYIMDNNTEDKIRLYHIIEGHSDTANNIRFYGDEGNYIISTSLDQKVRLLDIFTAKISNISQGKKIKNSLLPNIVDLDFCYIRQNDWDNMVTTHNTNTCYLWNIKNRSIGKFLKINLNDVIIKVFFLLILKKVF